MCIIPENKYETFDNKFILEKQSSNNLSIKKIAIKDPDNPANLKEARIITFFMNIK